MKVEMEYIINQLTGNRVAVGSTEYDDEVLANLEIVKNVLYPIIVDLITNAEEINKPQASIKEVAKKSLEMLEIVHKDINDLFEEIGE